MGLKEWIFPKKAIGRPIEKEAPEEEEEPEIEEEPEPKVDIEEQKRNEERMKRADLLSNYEYLLKRRELLISELTHDADNLETFASYVRESYEGNRFENRHNKETPEKTLANFNPYQIDDYGEIKEKAMECERLFFEIFTLRQKLKLHGIEEGLSEGE